MRKRRGFVRLAILHVLKDEPLNGYQIMKELEVRSEGHYAASAGTVYPALQELTDQWLIELDDADKKIYRITGTGKEKVEEWRTKEETDFWQEWKAKMIWRNSEEFTELRASMMSWEEELKKAVKEARGSQEKAKELAVFLNTVTDRLKNGKIRG
ncbi:PadR family transcriptional regulator [Bacillus massiliglaciei]|uniref:PadR family transcriptional regulator n=1 Tax=Bacillus massiliglaciei TaxID=1816693 RepID=UPI000DA61595|nr:PadR family transcriptional regulator [Bacillus massiliglaciei]